MSCDHCLRGEPENMDISDEYLHEFFSKIEHIGNLTITGGEPSLAVGRIKAILRAIKHHNVELGSFYLATNGKALTFKFFATILELYAMCYEKEGCYLQYSDDHFHEGVDGDTLSMLDAFKFTSPKGDIDERYVIMQGRGEDWETDRYITPERYGFYDDEISDGYVYLNCEGNIIAGCDFSYESQRKPENIVCSVSEMSMAAFQKFMNLSDASDDDLEDVA